MSDALIASANVTLSMCGRCGTVQIPPGYRPPLDPAAVLAAHNKLTVLMRNAIDNDKDEPFMAAAYRNPEDLEDLTDASDTRWGDVAEALEEFENALATHRRREARSMMTGDLTTGWDCIIVAPLDSVDAVAVRTGGKTLLHICSTVPEWTRSAVQEYTLRVLSLEDGEPAAVAMHRGTPSPWHTRFSTSAHRRCVGGWAGGSGSAWSTGCRTRAGAPTSGTAGRRTPHGWGSEPSAASGRQGVLWHLPGFASLD